MAAPKYRAVDRRLLVFVCAVCALQTANNFLPYLGLRDDSCQTMFSGLDWTADWNNHLFLPQHPVSDLWDYHEEVQVEIEPPPDPDSRDADLRDWLAQDDRRLNTEATRVVVRQLCDAGHRVRLTIGARRHDDACHVPSLSEPSPLIPVRLYEPDLPPRVER